MANAPTHEELRTTHRVFEYLRDQIMGEMEVDELGDPVLRSEAALDRALDAAGPNDILATESALLACGYGTICMRLDYFAELALST